MISRNFGCDTPPGLRLMTKTCSTSGWFRHSSRTPSPTIPVAPVMIALVFIHCVLPTSAGPPRARLAIGLLQPHENHRPNHRARTWPRLQEETPSAWINVYSCRGLQMRRQDLRHGARQAFGIVDVQELVGSMRIRLRTQDPGDHEL